MKILRTSLFLALGLTASAAVACPDGHKKAMADMSPAEHQKMMDGKFAKMDLDKNGSISRAEFAKHHEGMMEGHHEGMMEKHEDKPKSSDDDSEHEH